MEQSQWILERRGPEEASRGDCPQTSCLLDFWLPLSHPYSLQPFLSSWISSRLMA